MVKRLTKTGNSVALVLDKPFLERTGIDVDAPVEVSTNGQMIVISQARDKKRTEKLRKITEELDKEYGGVFKRLAE